MIATLKKEQQGDDDKKAYCAAEFDTADDKKKALEWKVATHETEIAELEEAVSRVSDEIKALEAGIKALDASVAEATEQRKEEHEDFTELMAADSAAKDVLNFARNRLNQFYNPALYHPPAEKVLAADDQIVANLGGAVFAQGKEAPPPPPETFGAYVTKKEGTAGVIAMMDLLIKGLDKEMTAAQTAEADAQTDYEALMADSAEKRAADLASLTQKGAAKADMQASLQNENAG